LIRDMGKMWERTIGEDRLPVTNNTIKDVFNKVGNRGRDNREVVLLSKLGGLLLFEERRKSDDKEDQKAEERGKDKGTADSRAQVKKRKSSLCSSQLPETER